MAGRLDGVRAAITGAAGGIGKASAAAFLREGAAVAVIDRELGLAEAAAGELAPLGPVHAFEADVRDPGGCGAAMAAAGRAMGGLTTLVNNAGLSGRGPFTELAPETIDALVDVNLRGVIHASRAAIPLMLETGGDLSIVSLSSQAGKRGWDGLSVYGATKAAVIGLMRGLAVELAPRIRCNSVCPGHIGDVGMAWRGFEQRGRDEGGTTAGVAEAFAREFIPLGRLQSAEDIANGVVFLASPEAGEITGAALNIGGGVAMD